MILNELCQKIDEIVIPDNAREVDITGIKTDSRDVNVGNLFVCLKGELSDGNDFVENALDNGAKAIITSCSIEVPEVPEDVILLQHENPKKILPILLNCFYNNPSKNISLIGITGTNGKTTTSYLIESIYQAAQRPCGVIGTVNYRFSGKVFPAKNTTPGLVDNFSYLDRMINDQVNTCVIEVSSHALMQGRVDGLRFDQAVFTNLTSDHLDYHLNQEEYFKAKARFFDGTVAIKDAVINVDDPYGQRLKTMVKGSTLTYGIDSEAYLKAGIIESSLNGSFFVLSSGGSQIDITTPLIGKHNIYNILAAVGVCIKQGFSLEYIKAGIESLRGVPGRLERIEEAKGLFVFVDYAHTEDALKNVLSSIRKAGATRILVVFGCGGDRDTTKRPKMASVVEEFADVAIVTNDNPRTENPKNIKNDILKGFQGNNYEVVLDRAEAIAKALEMATEGDCVLIAGKGHEDYQIFHDQTIHFDDRETVRNILKG